MRFIDKDFNIKGIGVDILFTFTPQLWKLTMFKFRKTVIFYPGRMLNICFLGFQFRLVIGKYQK